MSKGDAVRNKHQRKPVCTGQPNLRIFYWDGRGYSPRTLIPPFVTTSKRADYSWQWTNLKEESTERETDWKKKNTTTHLITSTLFASGYIFLTMVGWQRVVSKVSHVYPRTTTFRHFAAQKETLCMPNRGGYILFGTAHKSRTTYDVLYRSSNWVTVSLSLSLKWWKWINFLVRN